jgi:hypothetical protein
MNDLPMDALTKGKGNKISFNKDRIVFTINSKNPTKYWKKFASTSKKCPKQTAYGR